VNQVSSVGKITGHRQEHMLSVEGGTHRQRVAEDGPIGKMP